MARLIIVRHGNTFEAGEPPRRVGGATDLPLTDAGRAQADRLAAAFVREGFAIDRILSSPLRRTTETAQRITTVLTPDLPIEFAGWLTEIDHGSDEDRPEADVAARLGPALAAWDEAGTLPPGWRADIGAIVAGWQRLLDGLRGSDGNRLVVTSNGVARFVLAPWTDLIGLPPGRKIRTGAWCCIEATDGGPRLVRWDVRP